VLVLALTVQAARLIWIFVSPGPTPASADAAATRPVDLAVLGRFDPFRDTGATAREPASDGSGLILYGVRTDASGRRGSAILAGPDGRQASYAVGETVAPGVVLSAVGFDHVVLSERGLRRRLAFPEVQPGTAAALPSSAPFAPPRPAQASAAPSSAVQAAVEPARLVREAGFVPRREGDRITGYAVVPRGGDSLLRAAGLQAGDVVTEIDGEPLDPDRFEGLAGDLAGAGSVRLTVERGGVARTVVLQAPR
jgi:general secretion pathway protein C